MVSMNNIVLCYTDEADTHICGNVQGCLRMVLLVTVNG